ncbi:hypothetical protein [Azospirillum halopraeferens]|uniref:hypothetical protein n=1 Tax=Azospirillum halopraeferens TaxID=34010 RepID=UPI000426F262|nr:hypothetical protein [Azospirillum halopraeferens]
MPLSTESISNWMHLFRWIVKLLRDDFGIDEKLLTRTAVLEEVGLTPEQLEQALDFIAESFEVQFPEDTLDEVVRLEELCLLVAWMKGFYKRPEFMSADFEARCRAATAIPA